MAETRVTGAGAQLLNSAGAQRITAAGAQLLNSAGAQRVTAAGVQVLYQNAPISVVRLTGIGAQVLDAGGTPAARLTGIGAQVLDAGGTPNARLTGIGAQVLALDPYYIPVPGTFHLAWTEDNANEGGHRVYHSPQPMDPQALPAPVADLGPDVTSYAHSGTFIPDSTHYFRVGAYNADGETVGAEMALVATHGVVVGTPDPQAAHLYWRINVTANDGDTSYLAIPEVELRYLPGGSNLATDGTATASSEYSGTYSADKALDGDAETYWLTPVGELTGWWRYQFASAIEIREITLQGFDPSLSATRNDRLPRDFEVQYSDDGVTWTTAWSVTGETNWIDDEIRVFTDPAHA